MLHPEQAFHRTLVAHIRGKDSRRPFDPDVEAALLRLLRKPGENIWDRCFKVNTWNVGKHTFKQLGYHEQRRGRKVSKIGTRHSSKRSRKSMEHKLTPKFQKSAQKKVKLVKEETPWCSFSDEESLWDTGFLTDSVWDVLWRNLPAFHINRIIETTKKQGLDILPPALVFLMKQPMPTDDPRFDFDFLFPNVDDCKFCKSTPVARVVQSYEGMVITNMSAEARKMVCANIGDPGIIFNYSLLEFWYTIPFLIRGLATGTPVWKRGTLKNAQGEPFLALMKFENSNDELVMEIQDISQEFPQLLGKPMFL